MIFYKEENKEKMSKDIKDFIKIGGTVYSTFPVKGGYLLHLNYMTIDFLLEQVILLRDNYRKTIHSNYEYR